MDKSREFVSVLPVTGKGGEFELFQDKHDFVFLFVKDAPQFDDLTVLAITYW